MNGNLNNIAVESAGIKRKKVKKLASQQFFYKLLKKAAKRTTTFVRLKLIHHGGGNALKCQGYVNHVYVAEACHERLGRIARNECAKKIINLIVAQEVVVDKQMFEIISKSMPWPNQCTPQPHQIPLTNHVTYVDLTLYPDCVPNSTPDLAPHPVHEPSPEVKGYSTRSAMRGKPLLPGLAEVCSAPQANKQSGIQKEYPKIPDSNIGCQMMRRMGWESGGLGREGNQGIEEPIMVTEVRKRQGLGMAVTNTSSKPGNKSSNPRNTIPKNSYASNTKGFKKLRTQPIITRRFVYGFAMSGDEEIWVNETLLEEDYRILEKWCKHFSLIYEFVEKGTILALKIYKPHWWATTKIGNSCICKRLVKINCMIRKLKEKEAAKVNQIANTSAHQKSSNVIQITATSASAVTTSSTNSKEVFKAGPSLLQRNVPPTSSHSQILVSALSKAIKLPIAPQNVCSAMSSQVNAENATTTAPKTLTVPEHLVINLDSPNVSAMRKSLSTTINQQSSKVIIDLTSVQKPITQGEKRKSADSCETTKQLKKIKVEHSTHDPSPTNCTQAVHSGISPGRFKHASIAFDSACVRNKSSGSTASDLTTRSKHHHASHHLTNSSMAHASITHAPPNIHRTSITPLALTASGVKVDVPKASTSNSHVLTKSEIKPHVPITSTPKSHGPTMSNVKPHVPITSTAKQHGPTTSGVKVTTTPKSCGPTISSLKANNVPATPASKSSTSKPHGPATSTVKAPVPKTPTSKPHGPTTFSVKAHNVPITSTSHGPITSDLKPLVPRTPASKEHMTSPAILHIPLISGAKANVPATSTSKPHGPATSTVKPPFPTTPTSKPHGPTTFSVTAHNVPITSTSHGPTTSDIKPLVPRTPTSKSSQAIISSWKLHIPLISGVNANVPAASATSPSSKLHGPTTSTIKVNVPTTSASKPSTSKPHGPACSTVKVHSPNPSTSKPHGRTTSTVQVRVPITADTKPHILVTNSAMGVKVRSPTTLSSKSQSSTTHGTAKHETTLGSAMQHQPSRSSLTTTHNSTGNDMGTDGLRGHAATLTASLQRGTNAVAEPGFPQQSLPPPSLDDLRIGDDVLDIFSNFMISNEEELEFSRNLSSNERLSLYMISDMHGLHFMLFSNGEEKRIMIRKTATQAENLI